VELNDSQSINHYTVLCHVPAINIYSYNCNLLRSIMNYKWLLFCERTFVIFELWSLLILIMFCIFLHLKWYKRAQLSILVTDLKWTVITRHTESKYNISMKICLIVLSSINCIILLLFVLNGYSLETSRFTNI